MNNTLNAGIAARRRMMIRNHQNTFAGVVLRKSIARQGAGTIGGARVLGSEDEHDVEFSVMGNAYVLPAQSLGGMDTYSAMDAPFGEDAEYQYIIEPEFAPGTDGYFEVKKGDIIGFEFGDLRLVFELVGRSAPIYTAPGLVIWAASRRADGDIFPD